MLAGPVLKDLAGFLLALLSAALSLFSFTQSEYLMRARTWPRSCFLKYKYNLISILGYAAVFLSGNV